MYCQATALEDFVLTKDSLYELIVRELPVLLFTLRPDVEQAINTLVHVKQDIQGLATLEMLSQNALLAREKEKPLCQDTGTVRIMLEIGEQFGLVPSDILSRVDEAVAFVYTKHFGRKSVVFDALTNRTNTQDNTPAFAEVTFVPGSSCYIHFMLKGGGSDNASRVCMLEPGAGVKGVKEAVLQVVKEKAAFACPPVIIGVGVGGTFDSVSRLAKHALFREVGSSHTNEQIALLEKELLEEINSFGIGAGAFGGSTTALGVFVETAPCHIAALPVAINICCSAMRHASFTIKGG